MDNIEQIKQERDKLQERLNNAAKFFREQKTQIEALTKENEELKKNQNIVDYDETIQNLHTRLAESQNEVGEVKEANKALIEENNKLKELTDDDLKRYNELEDNYEGLQNKYHELETKFKEEIKNVLSSKMLLDEANAKIEAKNKAHKDLEIKFNEVNEKNIKSYKDLQEKFDKLDGDYTELKGLMAAKEQFNKTLQDTYNEVYAELNELKETNKKNVNYCEDLKKKYDDLENEKLAWEADYKNLEEQFENIKIQEKLNKEAAARAGELYEECEKYHNFMKGLYQLTKTVNIEWLSPNEMNEDQKKQTTNKDTKSEMIIESNTKRIGSEFETTNEVMSI